MKIAVEEKYTRAAPGGVGFSKNAGNYGGSMLAATIAKQKWVRPGIVDRCL
jgi:branched-chain amino acid aminotransferase